MNAIDQKQAAIFIVVFSVVALLINSTQGFSISPSRIPASTTTSAAPQQSAQNTVAQNAQYLGRYLNGVFIQKAGSRGVAIVVANENGGLNSTVANALANRFKSASTQVYPSVFTPAFIADGLFNDALTGSREVARKLDLAGAVASLVLAREGVEYSQNPALENVLTATITLDVHVVPVSGSSEIQSWTFTANGPGFSKEVARKAAEDRLIQQIAADTKMSLN